jgi:hypothetical protein
MHLGGQSFHVLIEKLPGFTKYMIQSLKSGFYLHIIHIEASLSISIASIDVSATFDTAITEPGQNSSILALATLQLR